MNGNLDKKNGFLYAKAAVAALCGAFTAAFGWLGWLVESGNRWDSQMHTVR